MPDLPEGCTLIDLPSVGSTNDEARLRAQDGAADGTVVWAREQTAGRGRCGRGWSSPIGNLFTSTLFRPQRNAAQAAQLSLVTAVALADTLAALLSARPVACKWPNDILVDGKKTAGILLESHGYGDVVDWVIVGCGINVVSHPEETAYPTTHVNAEVAGDVALDALLEQYLRHLFSWRDRWLEEGVEPVRRAWVARAAGLGEAITVRLPDRELSGRFEDMDADGALLLRLPDGGQRAITAGDVFLGNGNHAAGN